jgi:hypothetical protein
MNLVDLGLVFFSHCNYGNIVEKAYKEVPN